MLRLEKFDPKKTYMFVDGSLATPERIVEANPAIEHFAHVLELNGDVVQAVMNLSALRGIYDIDKSLSEAEAIAAIEVITNTPAPVVIAADERLAAAQEFSNLMLLDDTVVGKKTLTIIDDKHAALIKENYTKGLWSERMLEKAVTKGVISEAQKTEIVTM